MYFVLLKCLFEAFFILLKTIALLVFETLLLKIILKLKFWLQNKRFFVNFFLKKASKSVLRVCVCVCHYDAIECARVFLITSSSLVLVVVVVM